MDWDSIGSAFKDLFFGMAPAIGSGIARGAIGALLPGQSGSTSYQGFDARTGTGQQAEAVRLNAAKQSEGRLNSAYAGNMDPLLKQQIIKDSRAASAASGGLETGGHRMREMKSLADERNRIITREQSHLGQMTSGYTPLSIQGIKNEPQGNLWGSILTEMAGEPLKQGISAGVNSFRNKPDKKRETTDDGNGGFLSLSDRVRGPYAV